MQNQTTNDWYQVGKIKSAHGLKGEVYVLLFAKEGTWKSDLESCLVGGDVYKIKKSKTFKAGLIIALEGVIDRNQSEAIEGRSFSIPTSLLKAKPGEMIYLKEIEGFSIQDPHYGALGAIKSFSSNLAQDLLVLEWEGSEVSIPFVEAFIEEIEWKDKRIRMNLPQGLLEVQMPNRTINE